MRSSTATQALCAALFAMGLAGCGVMAAGPPPATFDLADGAPRGGAIRRPAILVAEPSAAPPYPTNRIVIRTAPQQIAYLSGAQWADQLPRLVQARLIDQLDRGGVGAVRAGSSYGPTLATNIRRFEIDVGRQIAVVEIAAQLLAANGTEQTARVFVGEAPAPHTEGADAPQALERALDSVARQMTGWLRGRA